MWQLYNLFKNYVANNVKEIFGPKRDEETGEWRRLHNTELKDLYGKKDITRKIKSHTVRGGSLKGNQKENDM